MTQFDTTMHHEYNRDALRVWHIFLVRTNPVFKLFQLNEHYTLYDDSTNRPNYQLSHCINLLQLFLSTMLSFLTNILRRFDYSLWKVISCPYMRHCLVRCNMHQNESTIRLFHFSLKFLYKVTISIYEVFMKHFIDIIGLIVVSLAIFFMFKLFIDKAESMKNTDINMPSYKVGCGITYDGDFKCGEADIFVWEQ